LGWPDAFHQGEGWEITENSCRSCPAETGDNGACGRRNHQSPINLERNRALERLNSAPDGSGGTPNPKFNKCIDKHWMAYDDSACTFQELVKEKAFTIERHTLKINQPMEQVGGANSDDWQLKCKGNGSPTKFGRIDFSKGFHYWWFLSHIDVHVPSEHTQDGVRYDAEIQMAHFYSVNASVANVNNEMATVSTFLKAYDGIPDWDVLNKIICQWRAAEELTRSQCGLPSVISKYPGCSDYTRGRRLGNQQASEPIATKTAEEWLLEPLPADFKPQRSVSAHDLLLSNFHQASIKNASFVPHKILLSGDNVNPIPEQDDEKHFQLLLNKYPVSTEQNEEITDEERHSRHLLNYDEVGWFNYCK
jgi:Eukaryotic-type carbonic anhydrase